MPRDVVVQGGCSWSEPPTFISSESPAAKGESPWSSRWTGWSWSRAKPLVVVLGQLPLGVEGGQPCGPGLLPGCGGAGGRLRRAGQRPGGSGTSGAANILLTFSSFSPQHRGQVVHAGQGHPGSYPQQASFIVV